MPKLSTPCLTRLVLGCILLAVCASDGKTSGGEITVRTKANGPRTETLSVIVSINNGTTTGPIAAKDGKFRTNRCSARSACSPAGGLANILPSGGWD